VIPQTTPMKDLYGYDAFMIDTGVDSETMMNYKREYQKSVTLPPKLQSPCRRGSRFGPPLSPVTGLVSPSNSGSIGFRASGCMFDSASSVAPVPAKGICALRTSSSNSFCSLGGSRGGDGVDPKWVRGLYEDTEVVKARWGVSNRAMRGLHCERIVRWHRTR